MDITATQISSYQKTLFEARTSDGHLIRTIFTAEAQARRSFYSKSSLVLVRKPYPSQMNWLMQALRSLCRICLDL